jgi:hypothetical protein
MTQPRPNSSAESFPNDFVGTTHGSSETSNFWLEPSPLALVLVASCTLYHLHYQLTRLFFHQKSKASGVGKPPPLVPHGLPVIGNIPFKVLFDPQWFVRSSKSETPFFPFQDWTCAE